jgi:vancomycin resistance protein YoaR
VELIEKSTERKTSRRLPWVLLVLVAGLLFGLCLVAGVLPVAGFELWARERVCPGVRVGDVPLGGLTRQESQAALAEALGRRQGETVVLRYGERTWRTTWADLGLGYDAERLLAAAWAVGREGDLRQRLGEQWGALRRGQAVPLAVGVDRVRGLATLNGIARDVDRPAVNAELVIAGASGRATPSQSGQQVDVAATLDRLVEALGGRIASYPTEVALIVQAVPPAVDDAGIAEAKGTVARLLQGPVTVRFTERTWTYERSLVLKTKEHAWTLTPEQIGAMIGFAQAKATDGRIVLTAQLDEQKVAAFVQGIAKQIDQPARDARFQQQASGALVPTIQSQEGRTVDVAEATKAIAAAAASEQRTIALPVKLQKPAVAMEDVAQMGIKELVGQGTSYFAGSSSNRAFNIRLGAQRLSGAVIPPGAVASFNTIVGPVSAETGYQEGYAIRGDYTIKDVGGGICQVATTAFRAAFWAGLEIVERHPHSYRLSYYELGGQPMGLDATVYEPTVDLKFRNNTSAYLLIQTSVDAEKNLLIVSIYGSKPGWQVKLDGPQQENIVPHGPPLPDDTDPQLAAGVRRLIQPGVDGMDVTIVRTITQGGRVLRSDTFRTHYKATREQWVVGTKQ